MLKSFISDHLINLSDKIYEEYEGALLFMDISGFTDMSEKLSKRGKEGTEELTVILNKYFAKMLNIIKTYNGIVLKFGGDALLVAFYDEQIYAKQVATECALNLMSKLARSKIIKTSSGSLKIKMKIVIQSGKWSEIILGDERRHELFLSGNVVEKLARIEDKAESGEIFVDGSKLNSSFSVMSNSLNASVVTKKIYYQINQQTNRRIDNKKIMQFLPEGVSDFVRSGLKGEHRAVSILFLNFYDYDQENPDRNILNQFFIKIVEIVHKHKGSINKIDISTKGSKLLTIFGAPISYENETLYAVLAAMEISQIRISNIKIKLAVASGFAYAGVVGSSYAKEYTVIGDTVNKAARLASSASAFEAIICESTKNIVSQKIDFKEIDSVKVKGKELPLKRFVPIGLLQEKYYQTPFVGREKEINSIIKTIHKGNGFVIIKGEIGIGKSRMIDELTHRIESEYKLIKGVTDELKGAFNCFESLISYKNSIISIKNENDKKEKLEEYIKKIEESYNEKFNQRTDELTKRLPFIGEMLFNMSYPGSIYERLDPKLRFQNLSDSIRFYIEYQAIRKLVIIFDDIQWMSDEDIDLINFLTRVLLNLSFLKNNITFIFSGRSDSRVFNRIILPESVNYLNVELKRLTTGESNLLINETLNKKRLSPDLINLLNKNSSGNPFFIEQFLLNLIEKNQIVEKGDLWVKSNTYKEEEFPENIWAAIMSRIDRLEKIAKECLMIGSVAGLRFNDKIVTNIIKKEANYALSLAEQEGIIYKNVVAEIEYIFRNSIFKDIIYDSILRDKRKGLHNSIGKTFEKLYNDQIQNYYEILAYHFNNAENWDRALHFNLKAGDKTKSSYQNKEAIQYYDNASNCAEKLDKMEELVVALREKADVLSLTGENKKALETIEKAINITDKLKNKKLEVSCLNQLWLVFRSLSRYEDMIDVANQSYKIYVELRDKKGEALSLYELGFACFYLANYDKALECYNSSIKIFEQLNDKEGLAKNYNGLGLVYLYTGDYQKALDCYNDALKIFEEILDIRNKALSYLNIGCVYGQITQYSTAIDFYFKSLKIMEEIGDRESQAKNLVNIGTIYTYLGDYVDALKYLNSSLLINEEIGNLNNQAINFLNIGNIYFLMCQYEKSLDFQTKALDISKIIGDRRAQSSCLGNIGFIYFQLGQYSKAIDFQNEGLKISEEIGDISGKGYRLTNLGNIYSNLGDYDKALDYYDKSLEISREIRDVRQEGCNLQGIANVYMEIENYSKARTSLSDAEKLALDIGEKELLLNISTFWCDLLLREYYKEKDKEKLYDVKEKLTKSLDIAEKLNSNEGKAALVCLKARYDEASGDIESAEKHFNIAISIYEKLKIPYELAKTYYYFGDMLKSRKDRFEEGEGYIDRAKKIFENIGSKVKY